AVIVALIWHAWVGVCSVWYDYAKPVGLRLALQALSAIWLVSCGGWAVQVLWRL
ncbi:MAG: succinate dehydrogenase, hydrophobic membrane anchor protein, partial [Proteobacteria bacterium]|nr:succinate dehydrogenase, hydrophobic membrane anchor protein [Pseudomonadota bacterium]